MAKHRQNIRSATPAPPIEDTDPMIDYSESESAQDAAAFEELDPNTPVQSILAKLKSVPKGERLPLADALALAAQSDPSVLIPLFKHSNWRIRWAAAHAAGK